MPVDEAAEQMGPTELRERLHWFQLDRRDFLKLCGGGLLVVMEGNFSAAQKTGRSPQDQTLPTDVNAWVHIDQRGAVTVFTGKVEIGQNIRTSLAQSVAEELRVPFHTITMVMGDTDMTPWDMGTFGSRSTPTMGPQLRMMASTARQLLVEAAARRWKSDPGVLIAADGRVTDPKNQQSLTYGEITRGQKLTQTVSGDPALTPATDWKVAGTPLPKVDGRDFVTGKHLYPADTVRPGMMYGKVLRPAGFNAKLVSVDTSAAAKMPGVRLVGDGDFIGVVAEDAFVAEQALAAIQAKWNVPPQISNKDLFNYLRENPDTDDEGGPEHTSGSVEHAIGSAEIKLEQHYTVQYIAHAPLEPRAAVAEWNGDKLTVWTGTQRPFAVRDELAATFHIPSTKVRVIMPDMGSAYGGKHSGECAVEASRLAKAAGRPVKLVWTREEEFTWAYFRPAGWISIRSGVQRDGTLVAWEHHNYNSGPSAIGTPYNVANQLVQFHATKSPLRQGSYRGLAATANHFARESHMDELACAIGMDPLKFRLKNLTEPRLQAVFEAAANKFGWGTSKSAAGHGFGIAGGTEKGGYVATCAEVEVDSNTAVKIRRVVQAWESGAIVNPNGLRNQTAGALVQAIGGALFEAIQFDNGRILNPHFAQYRVPRFSDMPEVDVVLIDRKDIPSAGAGEIGIVGLAPAVSNAIFAATGMRVRKMPMTLRGELAS